MLQEEQKCLSEAWTHLDLAYLKIISLAESLWLGYFLWSDTLFQYISPPRLNDGFLFLPCVPTTAPISKETILFWWKVWIITTALGKLELDTELRPSCKVSVWSPDKELLWYSSPKIHTMGLSPSINSTLLFLQDPCIIYGPPPLKIIICCVVFTSEI